MSTVDGGSAPTMPMVSLQCVAEGSRLRMRILSPGYLSSANCQCPRSIRVAGKFFLADPSAITLASGPGGKFFYRIKPTGIRETDGRPPMAATPPQQGASSPQAGATSVTKIVHLTVYGDVDPNGGDYDEDENECVVCAGAQKDTVFAPCGHYNCCAACANTIFRSTRKCPVCRGALSQVVHRSLVA